MNSELLMRLRALSTSVATLKRVACECARELHLLIELASCFDEHLPSPRHSLEQLHFGRFTLDRNTFSVSDGSRSCALGNTIGFRFFECLASKPNRCFTRAQLLAAVWEGQRRAATTIRSAVFDLRRQLRKAGMTELANALRSDGRAYSLKLDD